MKDMPHPPLFILCPGRSFSSVVCSVIGQHPEMYGVPELNLFVADNVGHLWDIAKRKRKLHMLHGVIRVLAELHDGQQTEETVSNAWDWLERHRDWSTTRLFHYLTDLIAPRRCVDKSPTYGAKMSNLRRLYQAYPDAHFLHISRHPRAVGKSLFQVYSAKAAWRQGGFPKTSTLEVERHWVEVNKTIMAFTRQLPPGQSMQLQGELLLSDPDLYLPQICEWLGISSDADAIAAMKRPEDSPYACLGPANAAYGNNMGFLENPKLRIGGLPDLRLSGPLDWLEDHAEFSKDTVELAHQLGYQ